MNFSAQLNSIIEKNKINLIFDIGANEGQFGKDLRSAGYKNIIVSFEPMSEAHSKLVNQSTGDDKWLIHKKLAIGDKKRNVILNISRNSVSSSILEVNNVHISAAESSFTINQESVEMDLLDNISGSYLNSDSRILIKIDTQGFEKNVINGANETLKHAQFILIELSLVELYDSQTLWLDMLQILQDHDFDLWCFDQCFIDPNNFRTLQVDALFINKNK